MGREGSLGLCPWRSGGDGDASSTGGASGASDLTSLLAQLAAKEGTEPQAAAAIQLVQRLVAPPPPAVVEKPPDEVFRKATGLHKEAARKHQGAVDSVLRLEDQLAAARARESELAVHLAEADHAKRVAASAVARQATEVARQEDLSEELFQLTWDPAVFTDVGDLSMSEQDELKLLQTALTDAKADLAGKAKVIRDKFSQVRAVKQSLRKRKGSNSPVRTGKDEEDVDMGERGAPSSPAAAGAAAAATNAEDAIALAAQQLSAAKFAAARAARAAAPPRAAGPAPRQEVVAAPGGAPVTPPPGSAGTPPVATA